MNWTIFFTAFFIYAAEPPKSYQMYSAKTKKYQVVHLVNVKKFLISKDCLKKSKTVCDALKATKIKAKPVKREKIGVLGHPAAQYCHAHNAENRILIGPNKIEDDFCVFKDGSMIMAWSLYNAHHSPPKKK